MFQKVIYSLYFLLISTLSGNLFAQKDTLPEETTFAALPLVYYTPETEWVFGAGLISNFNLGTSAGSTYTSQAAVGGAYTLLDQVLSYASWRIFTNENKQLFSGEIGWYKYVYFFYGIGADVSEEDREKFDARLPRLRFNYLRKIKPNFYAGFRYGYDSFKITEVQEGGILDQHDITGNKGGRISGIGPMLYFDSRDSQLYPITGVFAETSLQYFGKVLGSDFEYLRWMTDFRKVYSLKENQVFAWNAYSEFLFGNAPFFALPMLGGNRLLRGLFEGKYRDKHMLLVQGEYRWKFLPRWGAVAFSGLGNVFSENNPLQLNRTKFAYGLGGRFQLSKKQKLNFRFDFAHSPGEDFRIYLTFGEAF